MRQLKVGSKWAIYDNSDEPEVYTIIDYDDELCILITECDGKRVEWQPSVLEWLAEPFD